MKKNQLFIIIGVLVFTSILILLIWMQSFQGSAEELEKKYTIEIHNYSSVFKDTTEDLKEEMKAFLSSTELKNDGSFLTPIIKVGKNGRVSFGIPLYGMNSMRHSMNPDMYLYTDRVEDEREFFENDFNNVQFQILKNILIKPTLLNLNKKFKTNSIDTFLIDRSLDKSSEIAWNSMKSLRLHLDSLFIDKKIGSGSNIRVFYLGSTKIVKPMTSAVAEQPVISTIPKTPKTPKKPGSANTIIASGKGGNNTFKIGYDNKKISWVGSTNVSFEIRIMADGTNVFQQVVKNNTALTIDKKIYKTITQSSDIEIQYFDPSSKTWEFLAKTKCENLK